MSNWIYYFYCYGDLDFDFEIDMGYKGIFYLELPFFWMSIYNVGIGDCFEYVKF